MLTGVSHVVRRNDGCHQPHPATIQQDVRRRHQSLVGRPDIGWWYTLFQRNRKIERWYHHRLNGRDDEVYAKVIVYEQQSNFFIEDAK